ncbi:MAG: bifunctional pyr operon transcriptional regulator/uracil phosphoribosyltransferase PyrR [Chitinophagales bacterium]|nr:bifunctional pyr operon transcriptional regulator/uracil phosphoribosyltransferase PyrR [Chitinophagales bacterium]
MKPRILLDDNKFNLTILRLCHQLIENHRKFENSAIIGVQQVGVHLARRIHDIITAEIGSNVDLGLLDTTFHRDDFRRSDTILTPSETQLNFQIENKRIILVDDVLYTGRTIRAALDALIDYGRPLDVELLVLVDRRLFRNLPIQAKYVGKTIDSIESEQVKVEWKEKEGTDKIWILPANEN